MIRILFRDAEDPHSLFLVSVDSLTYDHDEVRLYWFDPDTDEYCSIFMAEHRAAFYIRNAMKSGFVDLSEMAAEVGYGEI